MDHPVLDQQCAVLTNRRLLSRFSCTRMLMCVMQAQFMYRQLTKNGIPAHMPLGKDFWDSAEVKTAMAMLRCLVQPTAAGEMIKRQLVKKSGLQVPIMIG